MGRFYAGSYAGNIDKKLKFLYSICVTSVLIATILGALSAGIDRVEVWRMGKNKDAMLRELTLRGYSRSTKKAYLNHVKRFVRHFMQSPEDLGGAHIHEYLMYLTTREQVSTAYRDQAVSALKFLYGVVLQRPFIYDGLPRPKK
jgi:hypothetical protein